MSPVVDTRMGLRLSIIVMGTMVSVVIAVTLGRRANREHFEDN